MCEKFNDFKSSCIERILRTSKHWTPRRSFRLVFDETDQRYAIRWIRQNKRGLFTVENGEHAVLLDGPVDVSALLAVIREATVVEPESLRPWLSDLASRLTGR